MRTAFSCVSHHEWRLGFGISSARRRRLLGGISYQRIVRRILEQVTITSYKREAIQDYPGYYRPVITLKVDAVTVDLFHNSSGGYRAQYYRSIKTGEAANKHAIHKLAPRIAGLLRSREKRTCPLWWIEKSILRPESKLWIHQGNWLRLAKRSDRNLLVKRWFDQTLRSLDRKKKFQTWASLTPEDETRIDLKGAALTLDGKPLPKSLKPGRSKTIHCSGYT